MNASTETLETFDEIDVRACEPTMTGGYVELALGNSLTLHVTCAEDTVSVVVAESDARQASIVVDENDSWRTKCA